MIRFKPWPLALAVLVFGCKIERPDPAASATALLHKHPSDFLDQLVALDGLASAELGSKSHPWVENLIHQSEQLGPMIQKADSDSEKVALLNTWIFDYMALAPISDSTELAASLPSRVLRDQKGSCLGLTLVYLALGQALELPVYPVFLPGHIFVRYRSATYTCNIETLRRGLARTDSFYRETFALKSRPWYTLKDAEPKQALAALVFNLGNTHRSRGEWKYALMEYQLTEEFLPGFPEALGNQGALMLMLGDRKAAEEKLLGSWVGDSQAAPARLNLAKIYREAGDTDRAALFSER